MKPFIVKHFGGAFGTMIGFEEVAWKDKSLRNHLIDSACAHMAEHLKKELATKPLGTGRLIRFTIFKHPKGFKFNQKEG